MERKNSFFLSLAHTACSEYPEHLLYPMDKKLPTGHMGVIYFKLKNRVDVTLCTVNGMGQRCSKHFQGVLLR